jgi:predicted dinucleotide-binding enzyme
VFNTTFAGTLADGQVAGTPLDVFLASDDETAKAAVSQLAADGGLRAIDVGRWHYGSALKVVA